MPSPIARIVVALLVSFLLLATSAAFAADLTRAVVVAPESLSPREHKAVEMLVDEVAKRSGVTWKIAHDWPADDTAVVAVGPVSAVDDFAGPLKKALADNIISTAAEGFRIRCQGNRLAVSGNDERGVLFGIGHLLRYLHIHPGKITIDDGLHVTTAPEVSSARPSARLSSQDQ